MSLALGIASLAAGIGGSIFGGISSANQRKREERRIEQEFKQDRADFTRDYYQDMTQRADMQYLLNQQREQLMEANRASRRTGVVAGGSTARDAAMRESSSRAMGNSMARIGAMSQQQKQSAQNAYRAARNRYNAQMGQYAMQGAQQGALLQQTAGQIVAQAPRLLAGSTTTTTPTTAGGTATYDPILNGVDYVNVFKDDLNYLV